LTGVAVVYLSARYFMLFWKRLPVLPVVCC